MSGGDGGQATVEAALALPVLAAAALIVLQVGVVARDAVLVAHAARAAGRAAAVDPSPETAARAARAATSLDPGALAVAAVVDGAHVRVTVRYAVRPVVPGVSAVLGHLEESLTFRVES